MTDRNCPGCDTVFTPGRLDQRFCAEKCRKSYHKRVEKERRWARGPSPHNYQRAQEPKEHSEMEISSREYLTPEQLIHFGLEGDADPFQDSESPEDIYLPARLQHIERALFLGIQRHQIIALVGEPGSGKSTILRRLYGRMSREKRVRLVAPASLERKRITHAALGVAILRDLIDRDTTGLSMEARSELLRSTLADQEKAGIYPALLIDEAHLLSTDALLALKQIWDSHTLFRQLAILLIGQMPLKARLRSDPAVRELTGRTQILELKELGDECAEYLRWRFARVNGDADKVFDTGAYKALATRGGHPLWVNNLAVASMIYAYLHGDERVTAAHVGRA